MTIVHIGTSADHSHVWPTPFPESAPVQPRHWSAKCRLVDRLRETSTVFHPNFFVKNRSSNEADSWKKFSSNRVGKKTRSPERSAAEPKATRDTCESDTGKKLTSTARCVAAILLKLKFPFATSRSQNTTGNGPNMANRGRTTRYRRRINSPGNFKNRQARSSSLRSAAHFLTELLLELKTQHRWLPWPASTYERIVDTLRSRKLAKAPSSQRTSPCVPGRLTFFSACWASAATASRQTKRNPRRTNFQRLETN